MSDVRSSDYKSLGRIPYIYIYGVLLTVWSIVLNFVGKIERGPNVAPDARRAPGAARAPHQEIGPTYVRGHANHG